jgi:hypothetical protein
MPQPGHVDQIAAPVRQVKARLSPGQASAAVIRKNATQQITTTGTQGKMNSSASNASLSGAPMGLSNMGGMGGMNNSMSSMNLMNMSSMGMMGMGMMGGMTQSGPLSWIYKLNYFVMSIGQMGAIIGMNSQALINTYNSLRNNLLNIINKIRTSEIRRIIQRKCKKSKLLQFLFVIACGGLFGGILKVIQTYWNQLKNVNVGGGSVYGGGGYGGGYGNYGGGSSYGGAFSRPPTVPPTPIPLTSIPPGSA